MRRWVVVDLVLVALVVVLALAVVLTWRADPAPATDDGPDGPVDAAGAGVVAFLEVDHTDMDTVTRRVLDRATGEFAAEYAAGRDRLVRRVEERRTTVDASLRALGLVERSGSSAEVVVAADSRRTDEETGAEAVEQRDRLRVGLERVDGRWLVSRLEYVR